MENNNSMWIIAIVAIVAIVGMVFMMSGNSAPKAASNDIVTIEGDAVPVEENGNLAGQATKISGQCCQYITGDSGTTFKICHTCAKGEAKETVLW